jgi:hypothetical protein
MYLTETYTEVNHQQWQDRLRDIEHQNLLKTIGAQSPNLTIYRKAISWLGIQLVNWGTRLQNYAAATRYASATQ